MNSEGPSDHLESLLFAAISMGFRLVLMTCELNSDPACESRNLESESPGFHFSTRVSADQGTERNAIEQNHPSQK